MIPLLCGAQWKTNSFQLFETSSSFFNSFLIDYKKKKIWLHQHTCDEPKRLSRDLSIEFPTQKFNGYTTKQHITYLLIELSNYSIESSMRGFFFSISRAKSTWKCCRCVPALVFTAHSENSVFLIAVAVTI